MFRIIAHTNHSYPTEAEMLRECARFIRILRHARFHDKAARAAANTAARALEGGAQMTQEAIAWRTFGYAMKVAAYKIAATARRVA